MGNDLTTDAIVFRGLLIPDPRISADTLWDAESDYDTASTVPGMPVPDRDTDMVLVATGTQTDGGSIEVMASSGGFPGPDGARFVWRNTADGADEWRGWDPPNVPQTWEVVLYTSAPINGYKNPHGVVLPDDSILVAFDEFDGTNHLVRVKKRDASGTWGGTVTVRTWVDGLAAHNRFPCLLLLPSGRVLCYYVDYDLVNDEANVGMSYSDDDGATWQIGQPGCLPDSWATGGGGTTYDPTRVRVAYKDGQYVMILALTASAGTYTDVLVQYASDNGARFQLVDQSDTTTLAEAGTCPDVVAAGGKFHAGAPEIGVVSFVSAFTSIFSLTATDLAAIGAEFALCVDDDNTVYAYGLDASLGYLYVYQTVDNGTTWDAFSAPGYAFFSGDATSVLDRFSAVCQRGRVVLLHNWSAATATDGNCICATYFGGYTSVPMPPMTEFGAVTARLWTAYTWIATDLIEDVFGNATDPGSTGAAALAGATQRYLEVTCDAGESYTRDINVVETVSATDGVFLRYSVAPQGGTDTTTIRLDMGATAYEIKVAITAAVLAVTDGQSGTAVGVPQSVSGTAGVDVLIFMRNDAASVWWRQRSTSEDALWTFVGTTTALTDIGGASGLGAGVEARIRRQFESTVGTVTCRWFSLSYTAGPTITNTWAEGMTNPDDLFGRTFSPNAIFVEDGVYIQTVDGPAFAGDTWTITPRSNVSMMNILPRVAPSPRVGGRTLTDAADTIIAWDLDADTDTPEGAFVGNQVMGCYLEAINFPGVAFQTSPDDTTWTGSNIDLRTAVAYVAKGNSVRFSSTSAAPYVIRDELVGGYFEYGSGEVRKIVANTEGTLGASEGGRGAILVVEGASGAETETGTGPSTGYIWPPRALIIRYLPTADAIRGVRLVLNPDGETPDTLEGRFQIGTAAIGPLVIFGTEYAWGRQLSIEPNVQVEENRSGARRSRVRGPSRRVVQVAWPDPVDVSQVALGNVSPDYYGNGLEDDPLGVALRGDTPLLLYGLLSEIDGPHLPVVYCPYIEHLSSANAYGLVYTLQRAAGAIYGRITSPVDLENVLGDEHEDELLRIGPLVIEEEV
jgi:hypothetical protein